MVPEVYGWIATSSSARETTGISSSAKNASKGVDGLAGIALTILSPDAHDLGEVGIVHYGLDPGKEVGKGDDDARFAVGEQMGDLPGFVLGVHRYDDPARPEHTVKGRKELWDVRQVQCDPIARFDASIGEGRGETTRSRPELLVGYLPPVRGDRRRVGVLFCGGLDVGDEVRHDRSTPGWAGK